MAKTSLIELLLALLLATTLAQPNCATSASCCRASLSIAASFASAQVNTMTAIAFFESSWGPGRGPNSNTDGSKDYGLLQINNYLFCSESGKNNDCCCPGTSPKCRTDPSLRNCSCSCGVSCASILNDDVANSKCATVVYRQGGYNQWFGYRNHQAECDAYRLSTGSCGPQNGCCTIWYGSDSPCCNSPDGTSGCCPATFPVCCPTYCCQAGSVCCNGNCCLSEAHSNGTAKSYPLLFPQLPK